METFDGLPLSAVTGAGAGGASAQPTTASARTKFRPRLSQRPTAVGSLVTKGNPHPPLSLRHTVPARE